MKWSYFPESEKHPDFLEEIIRVFKKNEQKISSSNKKLKSNKVLKILKNDLEGLGYDVESKKKRIKLSSQNSLKDFYVDAFHKDNKSIIEVEAGRALQGNNLYKDLIEVLIIGMEYLTIATRLKYKHSQGNSYDYSRSKNVIETLFNSLTDKCLYKGVLLIGY